MFGGSRAACRVEKVVGIFHMLIIIEKNKYFIFYFYITNMPKNSTTLFTDFMRRATNINQHATRNDLKMDNVAYDYGGA